MNKENNDHRITGYTQGTFDLFHVGHLRLLQRAKSQCDWLIVGVNDDALVEEYKHKKTIIPIWERIEIIKAIRCVDEVVITHTLDKTEMHKQLQFQKLFIGDDWKGNQRWADTEKEMQLLNVDVIYLPYTKGVSTSQIEQEIRTK